MKSNEVLASVKKYMFCNQLHINAANCNYIMYFIQVKPLTKKLNII